MSDLLEARKKLEAALQEFVIANYGEEYWLGDYVLSAVVLDMAGDPSKSTYMHHYRGPFHSIRGLTAEQVDFLTDLRQESEVGDV